MSIPPRLSLCVLCHQRPNELADALGSAVGFDEILVLDMASDPPLAAWPDAEMLRSDENLGVADGRNRLARQATGDVLVFLDDDAVFLDEDVADRIRDRMMARDEPAVIAFRVMRPDGSMDSTEYPFRGGARRVVARPCAYFVGCAAAIRRDAFLEAGGFDDRYSYSTEELDLAFAIARRGGEMVFDPEIIVEHRPSPRGRAPAPQIPALRLRNRLLLVRTHLPYPVAAIHAGVWSGRTLLEARRAGDVRPWRQAWKRGLSMPVQRRPLGYWGLWRMHRLGGRVFW